MNFRKFEKQALGKWLMAILPRLASQFRFVRKPGFIKMIVLIKRFYWSTISWMGWGMIILDQS